MEIPNFSRLRLQSQIPSFLKSNLEYIPIFLLIHLQELEFWGLTELDIEPCCWGHYNRFKENKETLAAIDDTFTFQLDTEAFGVKPTPYMQFKKKMWIFLVDPSASREAKIYAVTSMFFVLLSIAVFVLETHSWFRIPLKGMNYTTTVSASPSCSFSLADTCCCRYEIKEDLKFDESEPHEAMTYLDYICLAFFALEYIGRLYFAPKKMEFFKQPLNVIDIMCLLPHFASIIMKSIDPTEKSSQIIKVVLALRIIRVLRIFKLMKHYTAFKILVYTIKVSTKELLLMVIFLFTGVLIFASIIFYTDSGTFHNIPIGFWWALVTMTTVGYGDKVPRTEGGYIIGSLCVLCGVLTVAFTVPIVVNNFTLYYSHAQSRVRLPPPKREELQKKIIMRNQKAQEFIQKLTRTVRKTKTFNSFNAPKFEDCKDENPSIDSGLDVTAPSERFTNNLYPMESTVTMCSSLPEKQTSAETPVRRSRAVAPSVYTVSASVGELEIELPGTPTSSTVEEKARQVESVNLLHDLEDHDEKVQTERRRQLEILLFRREQMRQSRNILHDSPTSDEAVKPPEESQPQTSLPKHAKVPLHPFHPPPIASSRSGHSFSVKFADRVI
ncbi:unnamed protein product [Candidula unifasciata]|uniref:Ion transport domain-containing protein n=1 Tax=Candidula unifasciata TaxID=100452 RepID=A0A8S3YXK7_9EUPU|nr:unnamed protein product [Candidula unifasciata]